jgi:hypothetical protein
MHATEKILLHLRQDQNPKVVLQLSLASNKVFRFCSLKTDTPAAAAAAHAP